MKLLIFDYQRKYTNDFLNFLVEKMIIEGIASYDPMKTAYQEIFINEKYKTKFRKYIKVKDVVYSGLYNIRWMRYADKIVFEINPNTVLYGTNAKLYEICQLINNGNLGLYPYPIFTDIFEKFKYNIDRWYDYYGNGGL